jgi:nitrite reductase/ring-hydroxylating ferredoxin subunit/DMSO/TMAO reductase YedYZ heme-binding membrane subunit
MGAAEVSVQYKAVLWNRQKRIYDSVLAGGVLGYLALFIGTGWMIHPSATIETLSIRALGTLALLMLHVVISIGPLCRLDSRFLPLLYNRRHLGVATFLVGLAHGVFSVVQFHALGDVNPVVSLFISNTRFDSVPQFPFQTLGFLALVVLFLMAATSHDFWLHNLTAPVWKRMHMMVYVAYALLIGHVSLGVLQSETNPLLAGILFSGVAGVVTLHLLAARKEKRLDEQRLRATEEGFVEVCAAAEIPEKCARVVSVGGERVAVFRYDGQVSALSNVCRHQNGPLGEGRIIDGCVTCPWHGYQYVPHTGQSPPPFTDKVATFRTRVVGGKVWVHPDPMAPGTHVEPAVIEGVMR